MKIEIMAFWGAKVSSVPSDMNPETRLAISPINLCAIIIDGKVKGEVVWDGKELRISKALVMPREDLNP